MKATDLLKQQHEDVKALFKALDAGDSEDKKIEIFEELASSLVAHDAIERELFYPACEEALGMDSQLGEALVEHGVVEFSLYEADQAAGKPDFEFKCHVLEEILEHHLEEEENELFPRVEKRIGAEQLQELGRQMEQRFEQAREEDFRGPLHSSLKQVLAGALKPLPAAAVSDERPSSRRKKARRSA
jgi:hemerythrin superfamily protein